MESIILGVLNNNNNSQKELYDKYYAYVKKIASAKIKNIEDINEIIQNVFIKVFSKIHTYDINQKFSNWICTITVNECSDYFKKKQSIKRKYEVLSDIEYLDIKSDYKTDNNLIFKELCNKITNFIYSIKSERDKKILSKRYIEYKKYQEIVEELNYTLPIVKQILFKYNKIFYNLIIDGNK